MFDMAKMMGKMKEVQAKMKEAQENLENVFAEGEAGAGIVRVTVNGKKQVVKLEVDDNLINPDDKEMMQDLIVAAVNKAIQEVEIKAKEEIRKSTADVLPNIPGLDLSNLV